MTWPAGLSISAISFNAGILKSKRFTCGRSEYLKPATKIFKVQWLLWPDDGLIPNFPFLILMIEAIYISRIGVGFAKGHKHGTRRGDILYEYFWII